MTTSAVVLGAGGQAGIAWELGVLAGLAQEGIDIRDADVLVGTSAGSVVAAKLASGTSLERLFEEQVNPELQLPEPNPPVDFDQLRRDIAVAKSGGGGDTSEVLRRVGALARATATNSEGERRSMIAARLPIHAWPERQLHVVAVDTQNGERVVFTAASGVDFVDAVAASCAVPGVWPTTTIAGRRYMDGGTYSTDNADLASGCARVLIIVLRAAIPPLAMCRWSQPSAPLGKRVPRSASFIPTMPPVPRSRPWAETSSIRPSAKQRRSPDGHKASA